MMLRYAIVFATGGVGYGILEILYRGHTHWTMLLAGGLCTTLLFFISTWEKVSMARKCILGGMAITLVEFFTGLVVNIRLHWNVWDYSDRVFNVLGQICPLFCLLWTLLCIPVLYVLRRISKAVLRNGR